MSQIRLPVFSVRQSLGEYFVGVIRADDLLSICHFDYRRMHYANDYADFLGIQRKLSEGRIKQIVKYLGTVDACFPTSIVISIDEKCAQVEQTELQDFMWLTISEYVDQTDPQLSIKLEEVATIIDGQHRLKGLQEAKMFEFELPISIFVGVDDATEATIFSTVNLAQTKVNKSLAYDLFAIATTRSPEKSCHEIVVALDRLEESPFKGRIKRLGVATEGRFGETLSQATIVKGILPYISKDPMLDRDAGKRIGFWEPVLANDLGKRIFYEFFRKNEDVHILQNLMNYFNAVKERWPIAWSNTGKGNIINRTNGFNGFIRFLRPAYLNFTTEPAVVSQADFMRLLKKVSLQDDDFSPTEFLPGSSGAKKLYNKLLADTSIQG